MTLLRLSVPCVFALLAAEIQPQKPLRAYILAGQSNMEGHSKVSTFDYIGEDPATAERGASNAAYHYLGCAKTMAQIGQTFAEAILEMER